MLQVIRLSAHCGFCNTVGAMLVAGLSQKALCNATRQRIVNNLKGWTSGL